MIEINKEQAIKMLDTPFVKMFDLQYEEGHHYYDVSRREKDDLMAIKKDPEFKKMLPDAVSCVIVLDVPGKEERMFVMKEYRYPIGRFVLSVPSGLVDRKDQLEGNQIASAVIREIQEETGIIFSYECDEMITVNPLLLCSPGLTDESTAVIKVVLHRNEKPQLSKEGSVGTEVFDEAAWITRNQAREYLREGFDEKGIYYSAITWISLMTFVTNLW